MQSNLPLSANELRELILGMRDAYTNGQNVMKYARQVMGEGINSTIATLIAYDLQSGSYIKAALDNPEEKERWCNQLAEILEPLITENSSILEVGCGEATTLGGLLQVLHKKPKRALGFDISWSRCAHGMAWLSGRSVCADLFVGDLFEIPLEDSSVDVVYTSHSLEPNGGREEAAIKELLRVARRVVLLIEPLYELASDEAKARMKEHGYVRNLKRTAEHLGAKVGKYGLLHFYVNRLNPSGMVLIEKSPAMSNENGSGVRWRCPLTHSPLSHSETGFYSLETGIVYPVLAGIPLLHTTHAVVASAFGEMCGAKAQDT